MPTTTNTVEKVKGAGVIQKSTALNLNDTSTVTPALFTGGGGPLSAQVVGESGAHNTHVVTIQGSNDPAGPWVNTATTITAETGAAIAAPVWLYHRAKVSTAQGAASVGTITLFSKAA